MLTSHNYAQTCPMQHTLQDIKPVATPNEEKCWTHNIESHHIFINYRSSVEGRKTSSVSFVVPSYFSSSQYKCILIQEPAGGFVQLIYEKLSQQLQNGIHCTVFWDKKCLNLGQNFENEFLHGLTSATVIILLVSFKVYLFLCFSFLIGCQTLEMICNNATQQQDNVLAEYPHKFSS